MDLFKEKRLAFETPTNVPKDKARESADQPSLRTKKDQVEAQTTDQLSELKEKEGIIPLSQVALVGDSIGTGIESAFNELDKARFKAIDPKDGMTAVGGVKTRPGPSKSKLDNQSITHQIDRIDSTKTPYLIIQGGTNDIGWQYENPDPKKVARKLVDLYAQAMKKQPPFKKIMLITIPPHKDMPAYTDKKGNHHDAFNWGTRVDICNEELRKIAAAEGINLFDLNKALLDTMKHPDRKKRFALPGDGVHPGGDGYKIIAEILSQAISTGTYNPTAVIESQAPVQNMTPEQIKAQEEAQTQLEKDNPSGDVHKKYYILSEQVTESNEDENVLKQATIQEIRKNSRLLKKKLKETESDTEKITNLKEETARRIRSYTSNRNQEWYILNYQKFGSDKNGSTHEMNIGLGDLLLDPDIKEVLIQKDGQIIKGTRKFITSGQHKGRIGFVDENGEYIATFTGDKFRILSKTERKPENATDLKSYIDELNKEDLSRETQVVETENRIFRTRSLSAETSGKVTELVGRVRKENPKLSEASIYRKAAELAKEMASKATTEEEKRKWEIAADDCEDSAKAIEMHPSFDLNLFKRKIQAVESGSKSYKARNDIAAKKMNANPNRKRYIPPSQWAFGKYQFLAPTARGFGANIDPENEQSIQAFLNNPALQENLMNSLTMQNLKKYLELSEERKRAFEEKGIDIYKILAAMHFKGPRALYQSPEKLSTGKDWLGGSQQAYWAKMDTVKPMPSDALIDEYKVDSLLAKVSLKSNQDTWVIGSSTANGLRNYLNDTGIYSAVGANPNTILADLERNIVPRAKGYLKFPKNVVLVGMGVNGLPENNKDPQQTAKTYMETYMKIAKLFEAQGCKVKIAPLQLYQPQLAHVQNFNAILKNQYAKYYIETGTDTPDTRLADDNLHLTKPGYQKMAASIEGLSKTTAA